MNNVPRDALAGWQILVVEDDPMSLDVARLMLKHYGATVHAARDGNEGLEQAQSVQPWLILTDLAMPIMDGWEMVRRLKEDPETRDIPVIALTALAMNGDRDRAMAAGCHDYMTKPFAPGTFILELIRAVSSIPHLKAALRT